MQQRLCSVWNRGAKEAVTRWVICRRQKRPERVNRNEQCDRSKGAVRRLRLRRNLFVSPPPTCSPGPKATVSSLGSPPGDPLSETRRVS